MEFIDRGQVSGCQILQISTGSLQFPRYRICQIRSTTIMRLYVIRHQKYCFLEKNCHYLEVSGSITHERLGDISSGVGGTLPLALRHFDLPID